MMRKLIVGDIIWLDGYCEGPGGDVIGVIDAGTRAFENGAAAPLRLLGTRTWDKSGLVLVAYAVEPARAR
ncbi:hypothetical protein HW130_34265 [Streptomyces sp. PKU-EA00015]|uniref:hypothetical protein n=1 Tax=Streptomyces sp. PKU-EA00015 TaxID=2748326 RepID=UPI0015A20A15|nr:hypothetical protein [Streptomyces sp. PKU-EA00015]NWF31235.1 hypothetical protein [Streptomyces sp. PKU-EA00015]